MLHVRKQEKRHTPAATAEQQRQKQLINWNTVGKQYGQWIKKQPVKRKAQRVITAADAMQRLM